jgi:Transposase DDE domain
MRAEAVMNMISEEALAFLSAETKADYKVHKLKGSVLFRLLVYSLLTNRQVSLRVLETVFNSYHFKAVCCLEAGEHTRFNSLRDRIATIQSEYFQKLFYHCFDTYSKVMNNEHPALIRYDSTMVAISAALLHFGIRAGEKTEKKQVKFTIGFDGLLPRSASVFTQAQYTSENRALAEAIMEASVGPGDIAIFDRGLQSRSKLCQMDAAGIYFVTRLKTDARMEVISSNKVIKPKKGAPPTVCIGSDSSVYLFDRSGKVKQPFRLIKASLTKTGQPIWFLTNIRGMDAYQIAAIYKKRWDIEVFFKFIKQELGVKHILVRTVNGVEVMLYVTLITAMLLKVYQRGNKLKGYKITKMRFAQELEEDLIRKIVILCGGDPEKMYHAP